jgi:hypothetical protein
LLRENRRFLFLGGLAAKPNGTGADASVLDPPHCRGRRNMIKIGSDFQEMGLAAEPTP